MIPLATGDGLQPIEEIDFDCGTAWEPAAMREAKRRLTEIGASWTQRGAWLVRAYLEEPPLNPFA